MKEIEYWTSNHPLYKDGLRIKFYQNGLPYIKVGETVAIFSVNKFMEWLEEGYISSIKKIEVTIDHIIETVCEHEGVNKDAIYGPARKRELVEARQIAQFIAKKLTSWTNTYIGWHIGGKDRTTVIYSYKEITNRCKIYPEWENKIKSIISKI